MSRYSTAMIRFDERGRCYPVNCPAIGLRTGDRVLVRMAATSRLYPAEIVAQTYGRKRCRNSIVSTLADAGDYGRGPEDVGDADALCRFLKLLGWKRHNLLRRTWNGTLSAFGEWAVAFENISRSRVNGEAPRRLFGPGDLILVKWDDVGWIHHDDRSYVDVEGDSLVLGPVVGAQRFSIDATMPFMAAALWAEQAAIQDLDDPKDDSLEQIRAAVGGGGSAYLSDDVWL